MNKNIYPVFERIIKRNDKEILLKQNAVAIWLTGLSGSGKTSLGVNLEKKLFEHNYLTQVLDGDNIRSGINKNLNFTEADRLENIRRISEVTKLFINCGVITINCFISPTEEIRQIARDIIGRNNLIEVFVNTPLNVCEKRDVKGLYQKARNGEIKNFTGIDSPFETPKDIDIEINTENSTVEQSAQKLLYFVLNKIKKTEH